MKKFIFTLIQLTWGLPQTLLGFLFWLWTRYRWNVYLPNLLVTRGTWTVYNANVNGGLGQFIFSRRYDDDVFMHEYGHYLQSLILGPLYLIVIGIPSAVWCLFFRFRKDGSVTAYNRFYTEAWAEALVKGKRR